MQLAVSVDQGSIQHIGMSLQEEMGAWREATAHPLLLAHAVVDEMVHD